MKLDGTAEHGLHPAGVAGSIPAAPATLSLHEVNQLSGFDAARASLQPSAGNGADGRRRSPWNTGCASRLTFGFVGRWTSHLDIPRLAHRGPIRFPGASAI